MKNEEEEEKELCIWSLYANCSSYSRTISNIAHKHVKSNERVNENEKDNNITVTDEITDSLSRAQKPIVLGFCSSICAVGQ